MSDQHESTPTDPAPNDPAREPSSDRPPNSGPPPPLPAEPIGPIDLERTLRLMDVTDELRRSRHRVEEHLETSDRAKIREHLQDRYAEMGHSADPALLDEAIETALAQRLRFRPPEPGFGLRLAKLYVRRREIGRRIAIPVLGILAVVAVLSLTVQSRRTLDDRRASAAAERLENLTDRAGVLLVQVRQVARVPSAVARAEELHGQAERAATAGDMPKLEKAIHDLDDLMERLDSEYKLVVTKGRERDGVRHYLIVEARGADGQLVRVPIRNEESGSMELVTEWGERVEKSVYDRVSRDFAEDRVIDDDEFGEKRRGFLEPDRRYESLGQITRW